MKSPGINKNQQGFVAIFSVLIIMGILTLLTVGFSAITRQAQQRTLNDHLNSQAFYAAESGVAMASTALSNGLVSQKNQCQSNDEIFDYSIDPVSGIAVSCLLIDSNPSDIVISNVPVVGTGEPVTIPVRTNDGSTISRMSFDWGSENDADGFSGSAPSFLPATGAGGWGTNVGVMRVDLVPDNALDRDGAVGRSYTFYLYPRASGSTSVFTVNPGYGGQGAILQVTCSHTAASGYPCSAEVNLSSSTSSGYYMRIQSYYNPVRTRARVIDSFSNPTALRDGQAVIDVTGQANDVYRRIQVRMPVRPDAPYNTGDHNVFALFSGNSICKRFLGIPGSTQINTPSGVTTATEPSCGF